MKGVITHRPEAPGLRLNFQPDFLAFRVIEVCVDFVHILLCKNVFLIDKTLGQSVEF